ncbi:GNAT family N-acetyltransferase [soil metagenome]
MQVTELADVASFLASSRPVFDRDAAANNLPLGIAQQVLDHPDAYHEAHFWIAEHEGEVVGAAIRTAPYPVVLADPVLDEVVDAFTTALVEAHPTLPGVTANEPWATRFANGWSAATGASWRRSIGQGVYTLTQVQPPRPAGGMSRAATDEDRPLLVRWMQAFEAEALQAMIRDERAMERGIDARLGPEATGGFSIWDDAGRAVSLTGWMLIPGGARVGPVYTPPEERGNGYASSLVADVSASMLQRGAEACFLYTDLANTTSNAIYRRIGYEQVAESSMIVFDEHA